MRDRRVSAISVYRIREYSFSCVLIGVLMSVTSREFNFTSLVVPSYDV